MSRKRRAKPPTIGLPPGTAVYVGHPREGGGKLHVFVYDAVGVAEHHHAAPEDIRAWVKPGRVVWVDCDGVHDVPLVTELATQFGIHALALEDVLNTGSRPKLDAYDNQQLVLALEMILAEGEPPALRTEHVTVVAGPGFVVSFQEGSAGDVFDPVRARIRSGTGRIRSLGADYLLYALVDAIVDGYFVALDRMEDRIDGIEAHLFDTRAHDLPERIYALKSDLGQVRRAVFPLREAVSRMHKGETGLVGRVVEPYLRDLYDHVVQVLESTESGRDRLTGVLEVYLAIATHRMNDVMKVLTIVATVFIPLSWVAGIYGMNFDEMPELHWAFGYPFALGIMAVMGVGMLGWFRHRGWL
ncbi:MAG: magnesium/cobalt transporter CorA [Myxococcota bacterium]